MSEQPGRDGQRPDTRKTLTDGDSLRALASPALDAVFRRPPLTAVLSAWYGHVPFAQWLVGAIRPACLVELGTHNGVSYAAFCEAVRAEGLSTRCYAVDTWQGDEHAGYYDNSVYDTFKRFHDERYAAFSELLRCTFDDALPYIPDGSVDLLHIDGRHHYDDVRHDFETWLPKLSRRAVVLFHDTNVRERDFGVFQLWAEVSRQYPAFEFLHGHGLGVLAVGPEAPDSIAALTGLNDASMIATLRERFALLGERWIATFHLSDAKRALADAGGRIREAEAAAQRVKDEYDQVFPRYAEALESSQRARAQLSQARFELAGLTREVAHRNAAIAARQQAEVEAQVDLAARQELAAMQLAAAATAQSALAQFAEHVSNEAARLDRELRNIGQSRAWKLTRSLSRLAARLRGQAVGQMAGFDAPVMPALPPLPAADLAATLLGGLAERPQPPPVVQVAPDRPRILFVSGESHTPGTVYRVHRSAALAETLGFATTITPLVPFDPDCLLGVAAVVIWRSPWSPHLQGIIDTARAQGAPVFYDVDDLMFRGELATIEMIDGIRSQRFSESETRGFFIDIRKAMAQCDLVMCPTEELVAEARAAGCAALVVNNGFLDSDYAAARAARRLWDDTSDGLLRIGYAGGSRTHQRDFAEAADAVADILEEFPDVRLTLFRDGSSGEGLVLLEEFPRLAARTAQIEWRNMVPLAALPQEMARFAINLAPLQGGNIFCEAKSELKFFEAALVSVPTIASPTGPYRRAITPGVTGCLAETRQDWHRALHHLITDAQARQDMARAAHHAALRQFGPDARRAQLARVLAMIGDNPAAPALARDALRADTDPQGAPADAARRLPHVPARRTLFSHGKGGAARVSIIIPLYNYADYIIEALESAKAQSEPVLDLIVIDDGSRDDGPELARQWMGANTERFNRLLLLGHVQNAGLGFTRNSGFDAAETLYVLPLDADNRLLPAACSRLADQLDASRAAFAYPQIRCFGDSSKIVGTEAFSPHRLRVGNYIDAMALVRKSAWAEAGGYDHVQFGWEDYDFWLNLVECGRAGVNVAEVLAEYRVHNRSMLRTATDVPGNRRKLVEDMTRRHPWLRLNDG